MNIRLKAENSKMSQKRKSSGWRPLKSPQTVNIATIETDVAQRRLILKLNKTNLKQKKMTAKEVQENSAMLQDYLYKLTRKRMHQN